MTYDHELCILFMYHKCDELTLLHLNSLRKHNQDACIVPITDTVPELIPGSVDVSQFPSSWENVSKWTGIDTTLYRWFENRTFNAMRYVIIEYDCLCTVNLNEFYTDARDADIIGNDFFTLSENPHWRYFRKDELRKLPKEDIAFASGIVPFTCNMFAHEALEKIVANVYKHDVFCELRLGTTIKKLNLNFQRLPISKRNTICYHPYPWQALRPGLFHGIKSLDHNAGRPRQPGVIAANIYEFLRSLTPNRYFLPFYLQGIRQGLVRRLRSVLS
ncbi:MAG: hypothetical protein WAN11_13930 [Syntrophobacteraceae bacterium]